MKLYAVMTDKDELVTETISSNLDFVKADMFRLQSRDATQAFHVAVFDQVEKLTPPVDVWISEAVVAVAEVVTP